MVKSSYLIRYPVDEDGVAGSGRRRTDKSGHRAVPGRSYLDSILESLANLVDSIESLLLQQTAQRKALCDAIVNGANSLTDLFNAAHSSPDRRYSHAMLHVGKPTSGLVECSGDVRTRSRQLVRDLRRDLLAVSGDLHQTPNLEWEKLRTEIDGLISDARRAVEAWLEDIRLRTSLEPTTPPPTKKPLLSRLRCW